MIRVRDGLISKDPFVVRREVLWGECDPAGFVYTPRFADYAIGAVSFFHTEMLVDVLVMDNGANVGMPVKNMSYNFDRFLRPHDIFEMRVSVGMIGNRTFEQNIVASSEREPLHFTCSITRICVDPSSARSVLMPPALRARLLDLGGTARKAA